MTTCSCTPEQHAAMLRRLAADETRLLATRENEERDRAYILQRWGPLPRRPGQLLSRDSGGHRVYEGEDEGEDNGT